MEAKELALLQDLSASSGQVTAQVRAAVSSKINAYLLLLSLIALAEATLAAALIASGAVAFPIRRTFDAISFLLLLLAFFLLGFSAHFVNGLLRSRLGENLIPEDPEAPYLYPHVTDIEVDDFSPDEINWFFGKALEEHPDYEDIDMIYRRWVFQKAQTAKVQYSRIDEVDVGLGKANRCVVASVMTLVFAALVAAVGLC